MKSDQRQFRHVLPFAVVAGLGLSASWIVAERRPVPAWELDLTTFINAVPETIATVLYPVMQFGTVAAPVLVAVGIVALRRDWGLAAGAVLAGVVAWFGAKAIKNFVGRPRPLEFIPSLDVREGTGTGLGFISGHSAVAATSAVVVAAALPRAWRPIPGAVAVVVGMARIVHGVHLPADVVGGWSFGVLVGLVAIEVVDWLAPIPTVPTGIGTAAEVAR